MRKTLPDIEDSLRRAGLRCTPQRYGVMDFLLRRPVHATADEIHRALNRSGPRASRATVYNSLRALILIVIITSSAIVADAWRTSNGSISRTARSRSRWARGPSANTE